MALKHLLVCKRELVATYTNSDFPNKVSSKIITSENTTTNQDLYSGHCKTYKSINLMEKMSLEFDYLILLHLTVNAYLNENTV